MKDESTNGGQGPFRRETNVGGLRDRSSSRSIPERISQFYYALGFFCSSYPFTIIFLCIVIVLLSCFPLLSLPLPGNKPQEFVTPYENFSIPSLSSSAGGDNGENFPRWYKNSKGIFVQQILVRSSVVPWHSNLIVTDAFRGPLAETFRLIEIIKTSRMDNASSGLPQLCFHVEDVKSRALKGKNSMLPEFNCLILSPANFWQESQSKFLDDPDILGTVLNYQSPQKGKSGLAEILLGISVKDTGLKRYPFKTRQRVVTYAVTIFLEKFDPSFIANLKSDLLKYYPTNSKLIPTGEDGSKDNTTHVKSAVETQIVHIFYPSQSSLLELIPLIITYIAMFIYVYFSVKKVEMVTSKLGISFSALTTVVASLCMSVGLCCHFGVTYEVNAKAIFPYLLVIIGLENILVLMRSVVQTSAHLDIKIRVAQGLSKEGFSITKNLLAEVTILTIGFFTFIPVIQEFCILGVVGLLTDFFLQTFFFATVLSVDIRRKELSVVPKHHPHFAPFRTPLHPPRALTRVKSNPGLYNGAVLNHTASGSLAIVAPSQANPILVKIPKRLRLVSLWARTRFFQRTFIILMIGWISFIIYDSGFVSHFNYETEDVVIPLQRDNLTSVGSGRISLALSRNSYKSFVVNRTLQQKASKGKENLDNNGDIDLGKTYTVNPKEKRESGYTRIRNELYKYNPDAWRRLSPYHWQLLLGIYNMSTSGKYISVLPTICISIPVDPNIASSLRHHHENEQAKKFNWQALANEPVDLIDDYDTTPIITSTGKSARKSLFYSFSAWEDPYIPSSPVELGLAVLLAVPSVLFISYMIVTLYKCVCSRNYAEWRSNWRGGSADYSQDFYTQVIFEAVPLVLEGHSQEVECMGSDGNIVASVCLDGILKIWNATTGDNTVTVDRRRYFEQLSALNESEDMLPYSDGESGTAGSSPPATGPDDMAHMESELFERNFFTNSKNQYSNRIDGRPQSPVMSKYNNVPPLPLPLQTHHARNLSLSSFSMGNNIPTSIATLIQSPTKSTYENNLPSNHRRTSSFPSQVNSHCDNLSQSQPIPIVSRNIQISKMGLDLSLDVDINAAQTGMAYANNGNSANFSINNKSGKQIVSVGDGASSLEFRVGSPTSPLGKITERVNGESPPIWCLDCQENIVVLGTGTGRIELWDAFTGYLKCTYEDDFAPGVVCIKIVGNRVVAARINGSLDFLEIVSSLSGLSGENPSLYHRCQGHPSEAGGSSGRVSMYSLESEVRCVWLSTLKAHQQPITCLDLEGGRVLTGSQDHCLKVFRLEDHMPLYTLHGHYGPITCLFIDKMSPMTSGSASQDGMLCVWDLLTGMCMYSIQAHDGPVCALTYSVSYIISAGGDDKICVWERFQGHLLSTIQVEHAYCSSLVMLTHNLLITSKQGSLVVWDVRNGEPVRAVRLGHRDNTVFVRQIIGCSDSILCDYGSQLRLIRFPSIVNKLD